MIIKGEINYTILRSLPTSPENTLKSYFSHYLKLRFNSVIDKDSHNLKKRKLIGQILKFNQCQRVELGAIVRLPNV